MATCALALLGAGTANAADSVSFRVEVPGDQLIPLGDVALPAAAVAPAGAATGGTCASNSVIGALAAATGGDWNGAWTDANGWSIQTIKNVSIPPATGRVWDVYINGSIVNTAPCFTNVNAGDKLLLFPRCTTGSTGCFTGGPILIDAPTTASPLSRLGIQVWEVTTSFDPQGNGVSARAPSFLASVAFPAGYTTTDDRYGVATVTFTDPGPNMITVTKGGFVPGRLSVCATNNADGFCGSTVPGNNPFNALDFCVTTGSDGECNTVDKTPPVGHINSPKQSQVFTSKTPLKLLKGQTDRDPSEISRVDIRLKRQITVKTRKLVRKKKVRVLDKKTHKRKTKIKKIYKKVTVKRCYYWRTSISDWSALKSCNADAVFFKADGDELWSFEFLFALDKGAYTLDAKATDGKGNVDSTFEVGRNRINFTIK